MKNPLEFDPNGPFPLVTYSDQSYVQAQQHSAEVDAWLGLETEKTENALLQSHDYKRHANLEIPVQFWRGLPVQALQTPYSEIRWILSLLNLQPGETVVDLGCSYGRMGFVIGHHYPDVNFVGYELVAERVAEGIKALSKFSYPHVRLQVQDLTAQDFTPVKAQYYFIFDFGSAPAIDKSLEDLKRIANTQPIQVIARGRYIRHRIYQSHPWLSSIHDPQVFETFTIFRS